MDTSSVEENEQGADAGILAMLVESGAVWSVNEVIRERGDRLDVIDSLARLYGAGLIQRQGDFVFATRAAVRAAELDFG